MRVLGVHPQEYEEYVKVRLLPLQHREKNKKRFTFLYALIDDLTANTKPPERMLPVKTTKIKICNINLVCALRKVTLTLELSMSMTSYRCPL